MLNQILAKLVAKYPGLSKKFLGLIAAKMATKVTEESGIDAAIAELDNAPISIQDLASEFEKEGDRRVGDAKKEWDKKNPPKPAPKTEDDPDEEETEEPAAQSDPPKKKKRGSELTELVKTLVSKVDALTAEKTQTSIKAKLAEKLKDKQIPEKFYAKRAHPEKEEELDAFVAEIEADWADLTKDNPVQTKTNGHQPKRSAASTDSKADQKQVDAIVNKII